MNARFLPAMQPAVRLPSTSTTSSHAYADTASSGTVTASAAAPAPPAATRIAAVSLPEISPSGLSVACEDPAVAEVNRADNADPKRVGEYVNSIMKHYFKQEVRDVVVAVAIAASIVIYVAATCASL